MLQIETKEIRISDELKRKIEMIGKFTNTKPMIKNGSTYIWLAEGLQQQFLINMIKVIIYLITN